MSTLSPGSPSPPPPSAGEPAKAGARLVALTAAALLHLLLLLAWRPSWPLTSFALAMILATLILGWRDRRSGAPAPTALAMALAGQALSVILMIPASRPSALGRMLGVVTLAAMLALVTIAVLSRWPATRSTGVKIAAASMAGLLVMGEILSSILPGAPHWAVLGREWTSVMVPDPVLGMRPSGPAVLETTFPDDPRGDFTPVDLRSATWHLSVNGGSQARLVLPEDSIAHLRIEIDRRVEGPGWHIQLNRPMLAVERPRGYSVSFRIRADRPRSITVGFGQGYWPWEVTAFYRTIEVTPEWLEFREFFHADETDDNTRLFFDLNDESPSIELADVRILDENSGLPVEPPINQDRYRVRHVFNALGCRDDEPGDAAGRHVVLVLGDEATMGMNVRSDDTFAARLEDSVTGVEVVNCGVPEYGTHEALAFHQELAPIYRPAIVVLVLRVDANRRHQEERARQALDRAGRLGHLFTLWSRFQLGRVDTPASGYVPSVADVAMLRDQVRAGGGDLVVALFRTTHDRRWRKLRDALHEGLAGTDVAIIDLGTVLADDYPDDDLYSSDIGSPPNAQAHRLAADALAGTIDSLIARAGGRQAPR